MPQAGIRVGSLVQTASRSPGERGGFGSRPRAKRISQRQKCRIAQKPRRSRRRLDGASIVERAQHASPQFTQHQRDREFIPQHSEQAWPRGAFPSRDRPSHEVAGVCVAGSRLPKDHRLRRHAQVDPSPGGERTRVDQAQAFVGGSFPFVILKQFVYVLTREIANSFHNPRDILGTSIGYRLFGAFADLNVLNTLRMGSFNQIDSCSNELLPIQRHQKNVQKTNLHPSL
jgi:hypothetical protein